MPPLTDFLGPLHQGVWEVIVPQESVTEPLEPTWKRSALNVPSPGTIASYRKGQYHAHETERDYRVHLDRYDPERNPVMHLVDDAPLALMLVETMETLAVSAKDARREEQGARVADLRLSGGMRMALGLLVFATGFILLLLAFGTVEILFEQIIPALVAVAGLVLIANGLRLRLRAEHAAKDIVRGLALVAGGVLLYLFWPLYLLFLVLMLAVWFLSSAAVTLARVVRTRGKLPQGFAFTAALGVASLLLGYWVFVDPESLVRFLVVALGVITVLAGAFLVLDGYGMENAAGLIEAQEATDRPSAAP
ncbi:MAG: hypothetical protein ABFC89_13695 [Methanospirillum sp.]